MLLNYLLALHLSSLLDNFFTDERNSQREKERENDRKKRLEMNDCRYEKKERRTTETELGNERRSIFPILCLSVIDRTSKNSVRETRWWYTIRNNSNRDRRQIAKEREREREREKRASSFYMSVYLSLKDHWLLILLLVNCILLFKSTFNVWFNSNKINGCTHSKGSQSNVI